MAIALCLVGAALEGFAISLKDAAEAYPQLVWLAIASFVVGAALQIFVALGYTKNRSILKSNTLLQGLAANLPMVTAAVSAAVLKNLKGQVKDDATQTLAAQAKESMLAASKAASGQLSSATIVPPKNP
jgi:hypothetical protein